MSTPTPQSLDLPDGDVVFFPMFAPPEGELRRKRPGAKRAASPSSGCSTSFAADLLSLAFR